MPTMWNSLQLLLREGSITVCINLTAVVLAVDSLMKTLTNALLH